MNLPWSLLRPHAGRLLAVVGLSAVASVGEALGLALFSVLLTHMLEPARALSAPGQSGVMGWLHGFMQSSPRWFFLLLAVTYIGKSLLSLLANYVGTAVSLNIADGWRLRLMRALLRMPLRSVPPKQGSTMQLVLDEPNIAGHGLASAGILVQSLLSMATIYATLVLLSLETTLILTGVALVSMLVLVQVFRYSRTLGAQRSQVYSAGYGYVSEMLTALRQVRIFGLDQRVVDRTAELIGRMRAVGRKSYVLASSPRIIIELVFVVVFVATLAILVPRMSQAALMTSAGLAAVAAMRLLPSFSAAAGIWVQVQAAIPALRRLDSELARLEAAADPHDDLAPAPLPFSRSIAVENAHFLYPGRSPALRGLDLEILAGQFVALVGPSGSGKSTLADLLCGIHDPDEGRVLIDGVDLSGLSRAKWRQQLGVVPQDAFLMSGTIRENLLLLRSDCPEEELRRAVATVGATPILAELPAGEETVIGERGVSLSGGQRQRLAIARVLVRRPRVLLLDEATSALDAQSEESIFRALSDLQKREGMTVIAIAHRLASVRHADRIFYIAGGRVAESGTHDELLARDGGYASLWRAAERTPSRGEGAPELAVIPSARASAT